MATRREFLKAAGAVALGGALPAGDGPISTQDLRYLRELATRTLKSASKDDSRAALGYAAITPGGDYPSLWIRDLSMAAGCGLIDRELLRRHVLTVASVQNGPAERKLGDRAAIPAYAIPDHIRFDGRPVFYPGTYSPGDDQGGEPYGVLPPIDDQYEFVHLAHQCGVGPWMREAVRGVSLFDRLKLAIEVPSLDPKTGVVTTDVERRAVGFGFCDGVYLTGELLFASLLRWRALSEMSELAGSLEEPEYAAECRRRAHVLRSHLVPTFFRRGWLFAATGVGAQPDVWGTAFALHLGLLTGDERRQCLNTLVNAVRRGTITYKGAVRHVPTDFDASPVTMWEKTAGIAKNRYQNGAYWHVPTGWLVSALWQIDRPMAKLLAGEMVEHFRDEEGKGAPWECLHPDGNYRQNAVYLASITLPLEVLSGLMPVGLG